jgi:hypothetical protein
MRRNSASRLGRSRVRTLLGMAAVVGGTLIANVPAVGAAVTVATPWSTMNVPYQGLSLGDQLMGVSCPLGAGKFCVAVGFQANTLGDNNAPTSVLAEEWTGRWAKMTAPSPTTGSELFAVSCLSRTYCMAVGQDLAGPLAELWNGSSWTVTPTTSQSGSLNGVSCRSTTCLAVGTARTNGGDEALAEIWNGATWTVQNPLAQSSGFNSVSCGSDECLGVGGLGSSIAESFNGSWTNQPPPQVFSLRGVDCQWSASPAFCVAVGGALGNGPAAALWNPSTGAWTSTAPVQPTKAEQFWSFNGVSCPTASICVAVGDGNFTSSGNQYGPLAEAWNGSTWSLMNTNRVATLYGMDAVSCPTSTFCVAVGSRQALSGSVPTAASWGTAP